MKTTDAGRSKQTLYTSVTTEPEQGEDDLMDWSPGFIGTVALFALFAFFLPEKRILEATIIVVGVMILLALFAIYQEVRSIRKALLQTNKPNAVERGEGES